MAKRRPVGHWDEAVHKSVRVVTLAFASWNQLSDWLRAVEPLRRAA
jgi:hypothetical protein